MRLLSSFKGLQGSCFDALHLLDITVSFTHTLQPDGPSASRRSKSSTKELSTQMDSDALEGICMAAQGVLWTTVQMPFHSTL